MTEQPTAAGTGTLSDHDPWNPDSWSPTVQITPRAMSEDQRMEARAQWLSYLEPEGLPVPEVELIRWALGPADYSDTHAQCLTDAGFLAVSDGNGGVHFPEGVPAAQEDAMNLAAYTCNAQYSIDPIYTGDWTEDQLGLVYDYWTQYFIPCMNANGHPIDESKKPSREAFVGTFFDGTTTRWFPTDIFSTMSDQERAAVQTKCPELPPQKVMYGG